MTNQYCESEINEIISLYSSGMSLSKMREILKRKKDNIKKILIENNVWVEERDVLKKLFNEKEIILIKKMYLNENLSTQKIANNFNVSKEPITRILKELQILRRGNSSGIKINLTEKQKENIKNLYLNEYKSVKEIGILLNLTTSFVDKYLNSTNYRRNKSKGVSVGLVKRYSNVNYDVYINNLSKQEKYRRTVISLTNKQPIEKLENYKKRGSSGMDGAYHLDHKYSILEGYKNNIKPEIIASLKNLVFIPWEDNVKKRTGCSITKEELINI